MLLLLCSMTVFSQTKSDSIQINHVITCLHHYQYERTDAVVAGLTGIAIMAYISANTEITKSDEQNHHAGLYIAGGFFVLSAIKFISAERWLGRSKLTFTGNTLKINF